MTTQPNTPPFLSSDDGELSLELDAPEQIFPCVLSNRRKILVHMKRPEKNRPLINLYRAGGVKMKVLSEGRLELIGDDMSHTIPFFNRHFIKMTKMNGDEFTSPTGREDQSAWIGRHRGLRLEEEIVQNGILAVNSTTRDLGDPDSDELEEEIGGTVSLYLRVWNPEIQSSQRVYMTHHHREITEVDNTRWRRATGRSEMDQEEREFKRKENYDMIFDLYVALFTQVDNVTLNGKECTPENRSEWIRKIPFNWGLRGSDPCVPGDCNKKRLIGEAFSKAFLALIKDKGKIECPEEDDFKELYKVLGDRKEQEKIRSDNPKGKHCLDLEASPNACVGCPNNPYDKKKEQDRADREEVQKCSSLLEYISVLYDNIEMGIVDAKEVTALEATCLRTIHNYHRVQKISGGMIKGLL